MSFETDLAKFQRQVDSFSIAGAAGNFHTGFSIGDDTRGAGAGARQKTPNTPEEILTSLENSFKNFTIRGGHDVSVAGSLNAGGFAISAKGGVPQEGVATGPPPPPPPTTGACCITFDDGSVFCSNDVTEADCIICCPVGIYQGDGSVCTPELCGGGACCSSGDCALYSDETTCETFGGTWLGDGSVCDPNPCFGMCPSDDTILTVVVEGVALCSAGDASTINTTHTLTTIGDGFWQELFYLAEAPTTQAGITVICSVDDLGVTHFEVDIIYGSGGFSKFVFLGSNLATNGITVLNSYSFSDCVAPVVGYDGTATVTW